MNLEKVIGIIDELIFEAQKEPTWKTENALRCLKNELLKEQEHSGTWEWITEDEYRCSECKNVTCVDECMNEPQYLYCPYCGCRMTFGGIWVK